VTSSRTVVIGSALPFLLLVGLVGLPAFRPDTGLQAPPASAPGNPSLGVVPASVRSTEAGEDDATGPEATALRRLRRSLLTGRQFGFSGTEMVRSWRANGSTATWMLKLVQRPGGSRLATVQSETTAQSGTAGQPVASSSVVAPSDPLTALSSRAIVALAAGYQLRLGGSARVAGRSATAVVARRDGHDLAKLWLDDETGLLLRQDVVDQAGRLRRTASFLTLRPDRNAGSKVVKLSAPTSESDAGWAEVAPAELARWRAAGWPCPQELAEGFVLLDVRRGTTGSTGSTSASGTGAPVLHLVYGDGLSAISVFVQEGKLDDSGLAGLIKRAWGDGTVLVRAGWPEVLVWQGDKAVFTAVGDDDPDGLQAVLSPLPRQSDRGALSSVQRGMGSALAWFKN
jgi:negative regulator of sigma E activity